MDYNGLDPQKHTCADNIFQELIERPALGKRLPQANLMNSGGLDNALKLNNSGQNVNNSSSNSVLTNSIIPLTNRNILRDGDSKRASICQNIVNDDEKENRYTEVICE